MSAASWLFMQEALRQHRELLKPHSGSAWNVQPFEHKYFREYAAQAKFGARVKNPAAGG